MIIKYFTDNDLYKFSMMLAIQKLYPWAYVRYEFINRGETSFPEGFAEELKKEVEAMAQIRMTKPEKEFIIRRCYFFDPHLSISWKGISIILRKYILPKTVES